MTPIHGWYLEVDGKNNASGETLLGSFKDFLPWNGIYAAWCSLSRSMSHA